MFHYSLPSQAEDTAPCARLEQVASPSSLGPLAECIYEDTSSVTEKQFVCAGDQVNVNRKLSLMIHIVSNLFKTHDIKELD